MIIRRQTYSVKVGNKIVGSSYPVLIQSMTNTDTENVDDTVNQIIELYNAGSEIVRVTVNTVNAGKAIKEIKHKLLDKGCEIPIVGDFHYNGHKILEESNDCAIYLDKYRINPGNVGYGTKKDLQFSYMINKAIEYNKPIRIGVNWGSLDQVLLTQMMNENANLPHPKHANDVLRKCIIKSALISSQQAIDIGLPKENIIISCKVSLVQDLIAIYSELALLCKFPLHLGLTEAGMGIKGIVSSTAAIANLLQQGVGDTIRVSITPKINESRTNEVLVAKEILQSLALRAFTPTVVSCPGCGRTSSDFYQRLAEKIELFINQNMPKWKDEFIGVENLKIAVMGCVVNGPGESKLSNIGISLPGKDESPVAPVYIDGHKTVTLKGDNIPQEFIELVEKYIKEKYQKNS